MLRFTPTSRAVARTPFRSARCSKIETAFSSGQLRAEQGRPLALGEPVPAGAAVEQPVLLLLAVAAADRQVAGPALAVVGACSFWQQKRDRSSSMAAPP